MVRRYFTVHPIEKSQDVAANLQSFLEGMKACEAHINMAHKAQKLCNDFPTRLEALIKAGGDRLKY